MKDVGFKNTSDVKWVDSFEPAIVNSNVSTDSGAELTFGAAEVLAGISTPSSNVQVLLSLGIVEVIAATIPTSSVSGIVSLEIGEIEGLTVSNGIVTSVDAFITFGVAEGISGTVNIVSNVEPLLTIGIIELVSSTIIYTSAVIGDPFYGTTYYHLANPHAQSEVSVPQLVIGIPEELSATSLIEPVVSGFIILGKEEIIFGSTLITSESDSTLTLGVAEDLSSTINSNSYGVSLLTVGINELLSSTTISISVAPDVGLDLGADEALTYTQLINSVVVPPVLSLGEPEPLSSSIDIVSVVGNLFTVGIIEILGSTLPINSTILGSTIDIGVPEELSATVLAESSVSVFLTFGITEPLSGSTHFQSFIRKGGEWSNLTIGHVELLGHTSYTTSLVYQTPLDIGVAEILEHSTIIVSTVDSNLVLGLTEFLSVVIASHSVTDASLMLGEETELSSSINVESSSSAFILMGTTEQLSATVNTEIVQNSVLTIGFIELLSSTILSLTITDAEVDIGGNEIQTATGSAISNTYAVLSLGEDVDISGSLHIQSNIEGIFSFGIWEMMTVVGIQNSVAVAELTLGEETELSGISTIVSDTLGTLTLGVTENLSVTNNIISVTTLVSLYLGVDVNLSHTIIPTGFIGLFGENYDPPENFIVTNTESTITTGLPEELTSSVINITTESYSILTLGIEEVLLSTSSIVSTAAAGVLTTGISELLSSTTITNSVTDAELYLGLIEPLSSTINVETQTSGILIFGTTEILSATDNVISFIRKGGQYSLLTLGIIEVLEHSDIINSNVHDTGLIIGIEESLSATYYILGNTQVDASLTTGKLEILESTSILQSVVTSELILGVEVDLSGTVVATIEGGTITGLLSLGIDETLSASINIVSIVDSQLVVGVIELISSTVVTVSDVVLDIILGQPESLASTGVIIVSSVETFLLLGIAEQLDASIDIVSIVGTDLYLGNDEQLAHSTPIVSVINLPDLVIGIGEELSSHPYIQSVITSNLGLGILEVLGATSITQAHLPGELTIGVDEILEATHLVNSNVDAELELGADTPLSGNVGIISYSVSLLTIGKAELLATSNFSISITDATLTLGVVEELSHLEYIHSNVSSELTLGIDNPLSHSTTITSVVNDTNLIVGVVELLASTSISTLSTPPAPISFGLPEPVTGSTLIQSNVSINPDMIIGIDELFSSTNASTLSFPPAELTLGSPEVLSATIHIQPSVEDVLNLGGQENLSSTIVVGHLVLNTIDLVIGGPVPITASIDIESKATGTWLYVPGNLEVLSSTINCIVSIDPNLTDDSEILESTDNIITSSEASELSTGITEVASSINFTISIVASTLLDVPDILNSTNNIVSNTVNAELTMGKIELFIGENDAPVVSNVADAELILGAVDLLSSTVASNSVTDADLIIGHVEELSSTLDIEFGFAGFLNIPGTLEILEAQQDVISTASTGQLIVGRVEISGSSMSITTQVSAISLDTGSSEELSASILAWSVTFAAKMTIGEVGVEELTSTCAIVCDIVGSMEKPLTLTATTDITTIVSADTLYLGEITNLSSTIDIESIASSNLIIGDVTELSGSIQTARSFAFANLTSPTIYLRSDNISPWNKVSSSATATVLNINGIIEVWTTTHVAESNVNTAELTLGLPDELTGTSTIQSLTNDAVLYIGYTELVSSTNFSISITDADLISPVIYVSSDISIQSVVSDSRLTGPEYLTGTAYIESDLTGNIVDGRIELVSAQDDITSNVNVELTLGVVEELSAICNVNPFITIPAIIYDVHLASDPWSPWNKAISNVSNTFLRVINGYYNSVAFCITADSVAELTLGADEILEATGNVESIAVANLSTGTVTDLSSTIFVRTSTTSHMTRSDYSGNAFAETEVWSTLTLGVAEHFESGTADIISVVENDGLVIGAIDFYGDNTISSDVDVSLEVIYSITSDVAVQSIVNVDLSVGTVTELTHTSIITTNVDVAELVLGTDVELTHGGFIESFVDGFIYLGKEYGIRSDVHIQSNVTNADLFIGDQSALFSQSHAQSLIITPYMFRGTIEELSASNVIAVADTDVVLLIGAVELLSSTIASHSVTDANLLVGLETGLEGTISIETNSSGHSIVGITEILTSTVDISSYTSLSDNIYIGMALHGTIVNDSIIPLVDFIVGSQEDLTSSIDVTSSASGEYITGRREDLSSSISLSTDSLGGIVLEYAEKLSASIIFTSHIYDLDFVGVVEPLTSSIHAQSIADTFLTIGISESLASSINLVVSYTESDLVIGIDEILTATASPWVESNSEHVWLDIKFIESIVVQSSITDAELTMGHADNSISSTVVISTECTIDPLYLGEDEILEGTSVARVEVATEITLGLYNETLSSSITITHITLQAELDSATIDTFNRKITADLQYWYDHFVVNHKSLNKHQVTFPASDHMYSGSFIELLFNDEYEENQYRYLYREELDRISWPDAIRTRLMLDPDTARYYVADGDDPDVYNINLYNIQSHDIVLLDRLLVYRLEPENATLAGINYDRLDSTLAKMIYIYLELKLTGDYSKYDNSALFTSPLNVLETCYETYLTQTVFEHVSAKGT